MKTDDLTQYLDTARSFGSTAGKVIDPATVVTAPWVSWKCQYGCPGYGRSHCCPPNTPDDRDTRRLLDSYQRAILFHLEAPREPGRTQRCRDYLANLVELEGAVFKDGFYKAFVILAGPCRLCEACAEGKGAPCTFGHKARPSLEACGIDVFQTARSKGFPIETLREKTETQNLYSLLLVDYRAARSTAPPSLWSEVASPAPAGWKWALEGENPLVGALRVHAHELQTAALPRLAGAVLRFPE